MPTSHALISTLTPVLVVGPAVVESELSQRGPARPTGARGPAAPPFHFLESPEHLLRTSTVPRTPALHQGLAFQACPRLGR